MRFKKTEERSTADGDKNWIDYSEIKILDGQKLGISLGLPIFKKWDLLQQVTEKCGPLKEEGDNFFDIRT